MRSMTGYGAADGQATRVGLAVEVKSVNQRYLDIKISAPREYGPWESDFRRLVQKHVGRGRVEVYVARNAAPQSGAIVVRTEVAAAWVKAWKKLKKDFSLTGDVDLSLLQGRNDIFQHTGKNSRPEPEVKVVKRLLARALQVHAQERDREGAHLGRDMAARLKALVSLHVRMKRRTAGQAGRLKKRLEERVRALAGREGVDRGRIVQETALMAEKADVSEELVRLESHLGALSKLISVKGPVGKRMDFLFQEVNRELNTIASKSGDLEVTRLVVDGKAEVEKLREQVQNIE